MPKNEEKSIVVENVYKSFNVYKDKANTIKEKIMFFNRNKKEKREVLKGINLTINKGEVVALIGVNGSRKINTIKTNDKNNLPKCRKNYNKR